MVPTVVGNPNDILLRHKCWCESWHRKRATTENVNIAWRWWQSAGHSVAPDSPAEFKVRHYLGELKSSVQNVINLTPAIIWVSYAP